MESRRCSVCKIERDIGEYVLHGRSRPGLRRTECRECRSKRYAAMSFKTRLRRHNLSMERYGALFAAQKGQCAICPEELIYLSANIDHDHKCCDSDYSCGNCVRGLLCQLCNRGLGFFHDSPELLFAACNYISTRSRWSPPGPILTSSDDHGGS